MKSTAPWSVKGIERDARETAKEAARREGMTVGEWLNNVIFTVGDPDAPPLGASGEIDGLKLQDIATAVEHLSRRASEAEGKSVEAVDGLARSVGGVVERLQRLERDGAPGRAPDEELERRLQRLEEKSVDRQRLDALKALEKAVAQVAQQFDSSQRQALERLDSHDKRLADLAERLTALPASPESDGDADAIAFLKDAMDGMSSRIARAERIASEAHQLNADAANSADAEFVERTGKRLRVLGDEIKRSGDQVRALETSIERLAEQIDAAERRSAEGVGKVSETIASLKAQIEASREETGGDAQALLSQAVDALSRRTEPRIAGLQQAFDALVDRLDAAAADRAQAPAKHVAAQVDGAAERGAGGLASAFDAVGIDDAETGAATPAAETPSRLRPAAARAEPSASEAVSKPLTSADPFEDIEDAGEVAPADDAVVSPFDDDFGFDELEELDDDAPADVNAEAEPAGEQSNFLSQQGEARATYSADDFFDDSEERPIFGQARGDGDALAGPDAPSYDAMEGGDRPASDGGDLGDLHEAEDDEPLDPSAAVDEQDFLRRARAAAKQVAAKATSEDEQKAKRKLTPRQRAILAEKMRRKRLAEAEAAAASVDPERTGPRGAADKGDEPKKRGLFSFLGRAKKEAALDAEPAVATEATATAAATAANDDVDAPANDAGGPLARLKSRPTTAVLAVALVLVVAALAFLAQDMLFSDRAAPSVAGAGPTAAVVGARPSLKETADPQSVLQPRDLYLTAMQGFAESASPADDAAALARLQEAAALGHPPAQLQLGEMYKMGQGLEKDLDRARVWYERAANGGNVLAMHRLGVMSARGEAGDIDMAASVDWFQKAANFGLVDSQYNLGATFHPTGEGDPAGLQDRSEAYYWYALAARNGDDQAAELAEGVGQALSNDQRAALDARVGGWAAQTPDASANERVGA
ncbi:MAG: hypothetical protein ACFB00_09400 [Parvularculaceae bacterium]